MSDRISGARPSNHSATANVGVRSNFSGRLIIALSLTLTACGATVPSDPEVDSPVTVPDAWNSGDDGAVMPWSRDIQDPKLHALINTALQRNFDLQAVVARVDAARARSRIAGADQLPQIDVAYRGSRTKRDVSGAESPVANPFTTQSLSLELAWELDVWGRLRASTRAAIANYQATEKDLAAARLLLSANIARSWFNAVEAHQQTQLAEITQQSFRSSLSIIEQRFQSGIGTALDVRLARGNVATADANLFLTRRERDVAIRILRVLTGSYPDTDLELADHLPRFSNRVPAGLPSALLLRRPDLHAERWRVLAASERVQSSQKQLLPRFVLTGSAGTASGSLRNLMDFDGLIWNLVGGITQPIFQGGRIRADIDLSQASERELLALYAQTVLDAFNEVESSLAAEQYLSAQERALDTSVKEQKAALLLAQQQYENGLVGIITLLETQRRAFNAESAWLSTLNQKLQNRINLHLALGGDFYTI
jgi:multidrug efflux system outer membrane protein